ncbi:aldo/keto reductase [Streptomyces sp. NPDC003077]|uniref:aldo/keto reductase n=1 Tax=Streptomyces sp. NPDC003077 TaxID=3154443 RepID=UPI0033B33BC5
MAANQAIVGRERAVADGLGATVAHVASAWVVPAQGEHVGVLPGTKTRRHLEDNVAAGTLTLPPDALPEADAAGRTAGCGRNWPPCRRRSARAESGWHTLRRLAGRAGRLVAAQPPPRRQERGLSSPRVSRRRSSALSPRRSCSSPLALFLPVGPARPRRYLAL